MFRRLWSGLPKDVSFPSDLKGLGYFVNEKDEIRSIADPDSYFKFFLNRNDRVNARQRFEFNRKLPSNIKCSIIILILILILYSVPDALERIIDDRLAEQGLQKTALPLGTPTTQPHVPIFVSPDLKSKSRVVVIFGECSQDLGMIAGRVANGPGGINQGSMVSVVAALGRQASSPTDASPPGIVLANMGQLYWWPEGSRAITVSASVAAPLPSLVHAGRRYHPEINDIPGNKDPSRHVGCVFNEVLAEMAGDETRIDIVAVGDSCEIVERFLDDEHNWAIWGAQLNAMVLLGPVYTVDGLSNEALKTFLAKRTRGYLVSSDPVDTPLAPPEGIENARVPALGCPCYSSSEPHHAERILVKARAQVLDYLELVAGDQGFENPPITVAERPERQFTEEDWSRVPEDQKPQITGVDQEGLNAQIREMKWWKMAEESGLAPDMDSKSDSRDCGGA